jgi:hypothetical protein
MGFEVERVAPNALSVSAREKRLEGKSLGRLGTLSRFDKLKALSKPMGLSNGPLHPIKANLVPFDSVSAFAPFDSAELRVVVLFPAKNS